MVRKKLNMKKKGWVSIERSEFGCVYEYPPNYYLHIPLYYYIYSIIKSLWHTDLTYGEKIIRRKD